MQYGIMTIAVDWPVGAEGQPQNRFAGFQLLYFPSDHTAQHHHPFIGLGKMLKRMHGDGALRDLGIKVTGDILAVFVASFAILTNKINSLDTAHIGVADAERIDLRMEMPPANDLAVLIINR